MSQETVTIYRANFNPETQELSVASAQALIVGSFYNSTDPNGFGEAFGFQQSYHRTHPLIRTTEASAIMALEAQVAHKIKSAQDTIDRLGKCKAITKTKLVLLLGETVLSARARTGQEKLFLQYQFNYNEGTTVYRVVYADRQFTTLVIPTIDVSGAVITDLSTWKSLGALADFVGSEEFDQKVRSLSAQDES